MAVRSAPRTGGIGSAHLEFDLNLRAQAALFGLSRAPVEDILALLRSPQPIHSDTRHMLVMALEGDRNFLQVKLAPPQGHRIRKLVRRLSMFRNGQHANQRAKVLGRPSAIAELAAEMGKGLKAAEACMTYANVITAWASDYSCSNALPEGVGEEDLTIAYLYAHAFGLPFEAAVGPNLPSLRKIVNQFELMQARALPADQRLA
jgi:hypothetical protein